MPDTIHPRFHAMFRPISRPMSCLIGRRGLFRLAAAALACGIVFGAGGRSFAENDPDVAAIAGLRPGEYVWYPDRSPDGFVAVVVNLSDQRAYVYRNGVRIGVSTVSTAGEGRKTPTGVFMILGKGEAPAAVPPKDETVASPDPASSPDDPAPPPAPTPVWAGVALQAGADHPSVRGHVQLPEAFAKLLVGVTRVGMPVIIADSHTVAPGLLHPGLVLTGRVEAQLAAVASGSGEAQDGADERMAVSVVASGTDQSVTVLQGAQVVAQGAIRVKDPEVPLGNVVYVLAQTHGMPRWNAISFEGGNGAERNAAGGKAADALGRISIEPATLRQVLPFMKPGITLFVTDLPVHAESLADEGQVILTPKVAQ